MWLVREKSTFVDTNKKRKDIKRKKSYHSDLSDSDVCNGKKEATIVKVQMTITQFVDKNSVKETTTATGYSSLKLTVVTAVEINRNNHRKIKPLKFPFGDFGQTPRFVCSETRSQKRVRLDN